VVHVGNDGDIADVVAAVHRNWGALKRGKKARKAAARWKQTAGRSKGVKRQIMAIWRISPQGESENLYGILAPRPQNQWHFIPEPPFRKDLL
jgi:hypothetical protein